jgi:hypothetical protein
MSAYRIKKLGAHVVVGTEDEAVLICSNLDVARRAVADAECAPTIPTWELLSQRAARIGEEANAAALAADLAAMIFDPAAQDRSDDDLA